MMVQYKEALSALTEMRSRFDTGFSSSDKTKIDTFYLLVCGKRVRNTGCRDCYRDAYIETLVKLKKTGDMPKKSNYTLKAGCVIHPHGTSKFYTLSNIPDEVAETWLGQYPADISKFETFPTDYESRVSARKNGTTAEPTAAELKAEVERLNDVVSQKEAEIEALKTGNTQDDGEKDIEIETLKADLEASKTENESLNKTIAELKAEVESLKTAATADEAESAETTEQTAKRGRKKASATDAE